MSRLRTGQQLGHYSIQPGLWSDFASSAPVYMNRQGRVRRLLYHSGRDETLEYPFLPNATDNFSYDVLPRVDWDQAKTLNSNLTQQWEAVAADVIIREVWDGGAGDLTAKWSLLHTLYNFWRTILNPNEYLIWRPLDLTDKWYRVQIVDILVGGEQFQATYVGRDRGHERWMTETLELKLKLLAAFPPSVSVFGSGSLGSTGLS